MPWVRLHGVKDYYGMALHLLEVPEMRCTINLVPSLVQQLLQYTDEGRSDRFLDVSRISADSLSEEDSLFLLDNFFMANPHTLILPYPRYADLYHRRGLGKNTARDALRRFGKQDLRDLQVWFNLAWLHPFAFERDEALRELRERGRNYSEDDKNLLLDKHLEILRQVLPLHRQLAESGQVELTTTPFYHPILPLLFDKKLAREAMPDVRLPNYTAGYLEDASFHVQAAIEQHTRLFGKPPTGMWPAEGSVAQVIIPLLASNGIQWIATDEEILCASTHGFVSRDSKGHVRNPDRLYCPYKIREGNHELAIVFRDHALSDQIGFRYQHSDPRRAADDFLACLEGIDRSVPQGQPALVSVILDGENCWEHYPDGGVGFLRELYRRCTSTANVRPVTLSEHLRQYPPYDTLPRLFAGSWINHNFSIWIGHEEDNTAWDALHRTREYLLQKSGKAGPARNLRLPTAPANVLERAWRELYIAEGSDWFWWFGDDHSSAQDALFDYLFRQHLQNVYRLLGDEPPAELSRPISRRGHRIHYREPRALLHVHIDGRYTFFEWVSAGHYTCHNERGTMALAMKGPLREVYFGFDLERLLIRVDCDDQARFSLDGFDALRIGFHEPAGFELLIEHPGRKTQRVRLLQAGLELPAATVEVGIDRIAEMAIPFDLLGVKVDEPIQFFVELVEDGQSRDRAPRQGSIRLARPSPDFEWIMWDV